MFRIMSRRLKFEIAGKHGKFYYVTETRGGTSSGTVGGGSDRSLKFVQMDPELRKTDKTVEGGESFTYYCPSVSGNEHGENYYKEIAKGTQNSTLRCVSL